MLEIHDLHKRYGAGDEALRGVTFTVPRGQIVALVGPSGAGKSTLIRCVNRLVEPTSGRIVVAGEVVTELSRSALRKLRRRVGMIFQEFALIDRLTVMENVLSGRLGHVGFWRSWWRRFPADDVERAFDLLDKVELTGHVNKRADALSGGQRQRVGIARALMQADTLLLVDEPTASLDPRTSRQIMRLLVELARANNLAVVVNIHDIPLAREYVDRVIGLQAGQLVFDGSPDELGDETLTRIYGEEDWTANRHEEVAAQD